jgi:hypothetical protein
MLCSSPHQLRGPDVIDVWTKPPDESDEPRLIKAGLGGWWPGRGPHLSELHSKEVSVCLVGLGRSALALHLAPRLEMKST